MRAYKIGWLTCEPEMREREVLITLMHGLLDTRLSKTLDMEYQKPMYQMRPLRMGEVRAYIQRLEFKCMALTSCQWPWTECGFTS